MRISKKNAILLIASLLSVFMIIILSVWLIKLDKSFGVFEESDDGYGKTVSFNGVEYKPKDDLETFLVIGLDKFKEYDNNESFNNDQQADFLTLFVLDNEKKVCDCLHINRDTMVDMSVLGVTGEKIDTVNQQICLSHAYGNGKEMSCYNTVDAVSTLLFGTKINHYISLTLDAVTEFNDMLGGVEVTVLDDFTGIDDTLIKGTTVNLTGEHMLNYVKSRFGMDDSTNIARMKRQQQYMSALLDKILTRIDSDDDFAVDSYSKMSEYILSDCSIARIQKYIKKINGYKINDIKSIDGEAKVVNNYMEFHPDYDSLNELIIDLFYEPAK